MNERRIFELDQPQQFSLFDATVPLRSESAREDLPATARELVEVIGIDATIDLVKMFGGDDLKIPEVVNGTSRMWEILVETVGPAGAEKLVHRYAGTPLYIPTCRIALISLRDRSIIERFDAGEDFDKLRREHKITRRHLYRILKKPY
jgi:Mor family transcriptional regulator